MSHADGACRWLWFREKVLREGPSAQRAAVAAFLQQAMDQGKLRQANPRIAALHFKGLIEAEWIEPFLFQSLAAPPSEDETRIAVTRALNVFMAAYGP